MFDLHVHTAPDLVDRRLDDLEVVAAYRDAGYDGCVLKNHNEPTGGRAALARRHTGFAVYGSVVLNRAVGGVNPAAVAVALGLGARVVWMPTEDAPPHRDADLPRGLAGRWATDAVPLGADDPAGALGEVLDLVADADAVLATGHVGGDALRRLLAEARRRGVRRTLLTHPSWTVPGLAPAEIGELCARGAKAEITAYQLHRQPGATAAYLAEVAARAGDQLVLSSDAGHPGLPSPPEALERLIDALAGAGVDRGRLAAAASDVPRNLVEA